MNIITFGKYKGMPVTRVLRIDPSYFGWCKNNVRWFKFSKRDYEIYLEWLSLQQNHLQFTGYSDDMGNIRFLFRKVEEGKFNAYSDMEYLTKEPVWIESRGDEGGSWWEVNRVPEFYKNQSKTKE